MKTRIRPVLTAAAALVLLGWGTCVIRAQQTTGQKIGDKLDRAAQDVKRGVEKVGEGVREGFDSARTSVHRMGIVSRVYGRLHWDKALTDATITLDSREAGVIVLRGSVASAAAKAKAETLAAETVGVTSVVNELGIASTEKETTTTRTTTKEVVTPKP
jgi:osmotically-inducible protein OsmY